MAINKNTKPKIITEEAYLGWYRPCALKSAGSFLNPITANTDNAVKPTNTRTIGLSNTEPINSESLINKLLNLVSQNKADQRAEPAEGL